MLLRGHMVKALGLKVPADVYKRKKKGEEEEEEGKKPPNKILNGAKGQFYVCGEEPPLQDTSEHTAFLRSPFVSPLNEKLAATRSSKCV